jgi:hypothetical protein
MELMVSFISFSNLKAESIQRGSSDWEKLREEEGA